MYNIKDLDKPNTKDLDFQIITRTKSLKPVRSIRRVINNVSHTELSKTLKDVQTYYNFTLALFTTTIFSTLSLLTLIFLVFFYQNLFLLLYSILLGFFPLIVIFTYYIIRNNKYHYPPPIIL